MSDITPDLEDGVPFDDDVEPEDADIEHGLSPDDLPPDPQGEDDQ